MKKLLVKDIIVGIIALAVISAILFFTVQRDNRVTRTMRPFDITYDSAVIRFTADEQRMAKQFSDTTLPQLKILGLIKQYTRTEIETIIAVSGAMWNKRSPFFKESLLEQIHIYNRVNGYTLWTKIVDEKTNQVYAEISPPGTRKIY
ncbi:MAG: hypothetical protein WCX28_00175 [Bacteriovoracaceae bacterium]|nr:hypothetical protein [Bacteroidota bacterium]